MPLGETSHRDVFKAGRESWEAIHWILIVCKKPNFTWHEGTELRYRGKKVCVIFTYTKQKKRKGNGTRVGPEGQRSAVYLTYKGGRMMSKPLPITVESTAWPWLYAT